METNSLNADIVERVIKLAGHDGVFITHNTQLGWYAKLVTLDGSETSLSGPCLQEHSAIAICAIKHLEDKE